MKGWATYKPYVVPVTKKNMKNQTLQKYNEQRRKEAIRMLEVVIQKLKNGEFIHEEHGWWPTNIGNRVIFRVTVISKDSEQKLDNLGE